MLEGALVSGALSAGADVYAVGVLPTPGDRVSHAPPRGPRRRGALGLAQPLRGQRHQDLLLGGRQVPRRLGGRDRGAPGRPRQRAQAHRGRRSAGSSHYERGRGRLHRARARRPSPSTCGGLTHRARLRPRRDLPGGAPSSSARLGADVSWCWARARRPQHQPRRRARCIRRGCSARVLRRGRRSRARLRRRRRPAHLGGRDGRDPRRRLRARHLRPPPGRARPAQGRHRGHHRDGQSRARQGADRGGHPDRQDRRSATATCSRRCCGSAPTSAASSPGTCSSSTTRTTGDGIVSALQLLGGDARDGAAALGAGRVPERSSPRCWSTCRVTREAAARIAFPVSPSARRRLERELNGAGRILLRYSGTESLAARHDRGRGAGAHRAHGRGAGRHHPRGPSGHEPDVWASAWTSPRSRGCAAWWSAGTSASSGACSPRQEIAYCRRRRDPIPHFAARFAAKEATLKALGTGLRMGVNWRELEVRRERGQAPDHGADGTLAAPSPSPRAAARVLLSLTHDGDYAMAQALLSETRRMPRRGAR